MTSEIGLELKCVILRLRELRARMSSPQSLPLILAAGGERIQERRAPGSKEEITVSYQRGAVQATDRTEGKKKILVLSRGINGLFIIAVRESYPD